ncbi:hypothetical protein LOC68_23955 [Blastopirellula sp. JC732]|uniref:Uncharacterized protein n=1 Tax=Blastopirellula sediminis TaxID=2894196 RepID=A0A9X1MRC4_9BACT|nr:hypothetical protein [Blastopirellula sediminis]MCC9605239.1 hypothetical protein [Blastopirellula sediminis]MCC9631461.1 hypothetical protein [Blastopirellula sediminis]
MPIPISRTSNKLASDARWRMSWLTTMAILLGLAIVVSLPGCSGCLRDKTKEEEEAARKKKQEEEQKKADFETPQFRALPYDDRGPGNYIKPGHWVSGSIRLKANAFDYRGELYSKTTNSTGGSIPLPGTNYFFSATRPIALAKGQESWSDVTYYVPEVNQGSAASNSRWLMCRLQDRGGGSVVQSEVLATQAMPAYQFYMVVLAANSDDYQFLGSLDTVKPLSASLDQNEGAPHYRVVIPKIIDRTPLPENPLTWTSIAVIVWDDIDQQALTTYQQEALLDWLHWGGQLIISGPASLDRLKLSFLADYLPAQSEGAEELEQARFEAWNKKFVPSERINDKPMRYELKLTGAPARGVKLKLADDAYYVQDTGDLVAERRIGRGRITVTAFQMRDPRITKQWKNFDNFFNGAILRRPARRFDVTDIEFVTTRWNSSRSRNDPLAVSQLRYFSRDVELASNRYERLEAEYLGENGDQNEEGNVDESLGMVAPSKAEPTQFTTLPEAGFVASDAGVAAWNDDSGAASAARECLVQASGIDIPDASFILRVTAVYLLFLVPINWAFFWMIGRVEWAWIAAPVIAIIGAFAVIKLAQLDIGFARNRTEIGILEIQPDYHRAHMARYTSLYTSLSTRYHSEFDQGSALALPLTYGEGKGVITRFGDLPTEVRFDQEGLSASLTGFNVMSNSTGRMHSEYMLPLAQDPVFSWKPGDDGNSAEVVYRGELSIRDVAVMRRIGSGPKGALEVAWIGDLGPKQSKTIRFEPMTDPWSVCEEWNQSKVFSPHIGKDAEVSLRKLLNVAKDVRHLRAGDVRLIGWTDEDVPGVTITPEAPQSDLRTLVLAHLQYAPLPDPESDVNTRRILGEEPEKVLQESADSIELLPENGPN